MSTSFAPGHVIAAKYRIERELGRGGMAVVYLAKDEHHPRHVAIKVLAPELSGSLGAERFLAEIRTTAGLSHPHILPLIDSGDEDGRLFFVTPLVEGETLQERLRRDGPLPVDEALVLGASLADALAHAHARGVIHRDVKPANILLDDAGNAYLADFGIARALATGEDALRTSTGFVVGTPQYMSPERIAGDRQVSGAADLYALACVIYEILAGTPPFNASSGQATLAAHLIKPPPSIRTVRPEVPEAVDELLRQAMTKDPAERLVDAEQFSSILDGSRTTVRAGGRPFATTRRSLGLVSAAVAVLAAVSFVVFGGRIPFSGATAPLDTTRYAVLPFDTEGSPSARVPVDVMINDAIGRWSGINLVDGLRIRDQVSRVGDGAGLNDRDALRVARALNAGRLVAGEATPVGDSLRVEALLLDATSGMARIRRVVFTIPSDGRGADAQVEGAIESLLFGSQTRTEGAPGPATRSAAARRAFGLGQAAMLGWDLVEAENRFSEAVDEDPDYALAHFWKAQIMNWRGRPAREWRGDALSAFEAADEMPTREGVLVAALNAMATGEHPQACAEYEDLRQSDPGDFAAWFGLGECKARDTRVQPATDSPTGWGFRGSSHGATQAYRTAMTGLPSSYRAFGAGSFELVRSMLYARSNLLRQGRSEGPGARSFVGFPSWQGDSLAILAVPVDSLATVSLDMDAATEATIRQRRVLLEVANAWVEAFPRSSDAIYTLASAHELVGDLSALDGYREARTLADDPGIRARIAAAEATLRVRLGLPHDLSEIRAAVALADSVLDDFESATLADPTSMAALALLVGRPNLAARLARRGAIARGITDSPEEVDSETRALLAFAAAGAPVDSIRALEQRTEQRIRQTVPAAQVDATRRLLLERPAFMAFPAHTLMFLTDPGLPRSVEARAIAAMLSGDVDGAAALLADPSPILGWDVLIARANTLVALGDSISALGLLGPRLDALSEEDPAGVEGMAHAGGLVRSAALRAELESRIGSPEATAVWAEAVLSLWGHGDEAVHPLLTRMQEILDLRRRR